MKPRLFPFLFTLLILSCFNAKGQYREIGFASSASMGIMYGPVLDARPVVKWGKSIHSVRTFRVDRTYMNYNSYQGQVYWNLSSGMFLGQEWRKPVNDKLYFLHGPEAGGYFNAGGNYMSITPSVRYQLGVLYKAGEHLNIGLATPLSFSTTFGKSNGEWNQSGMSLGFFSETNYLILTYSFEKKK